MVVGRDVGQRARLARLLNGGGYRVEIAESVSHACRIGFAGIALAIVAPDGLGPAGRGLIQDLRAAVGTVLLVGAPGRQRERRSDLLDISDEAGLLARVAEALAPATEPEAPEPLLQFGGYRLDLGGHSLMDQMGKEVPLTHGEFGLLRAFVQRAGRVLSRDQLLQLLAGRDAEAYDRSIDMQIVRLRREDRAGPQAPDPYRHHPEQRLQIRRQCAAGRRRPQCGSRNPPRPRPRPRPAAPNGATSRLSPPRYSRRRGRACRAIRRSCASSSMPIAATLRAVVARHGGVIAESRVREALAYFGYPVAQEHAAERALHAALALAENLPEGEMALPAGLAVRIGVASGLVLRRSRRRGAWRDAQRRRRGCRILPSRARSSSPQARGGWPAICSPIATLGRSLSRASSARCRHGRCSAQARSAAAPRHSMPRR